MSKDRITLEEAMEAIDGYLDEATHYVDGKKLRGTYARIADAAEKEARKAMHDSGKVEDIALRSKPKSKEEDDKMMRVYSNARNKKATAYRIFDATDELKKDKNNVEKFYNDNAPKLKKGNNTLKDTLKLAGSTIKSIPRTAHSLVKLNDTQKENQKRY